MMRGRIVQGDGAPLEDVKAKENVAWALEGDRGITYGERAGRLEAGGGQLVAGRLRGPAAGLVRQGARQGARPAIGDPVTVNVLGRNITATIANLRTVNWRSFGINFVHGVLAQHLRGRAAYGPRDRDLSGRRDTAPETRLVQDVANAYPTVTTVRVKDALEAVERARRPARPRDPGRLGRGDRGLRPGARRRARGRPARAHLRRRGAEDARRDARPAAGRASPARIWRCSAPRRPCSACWPARAAALFVVTRLMGLRFTLLWPSALAAAAGALLVTIVLGLAGTWRVLGRSRLHT